MIIKRLGKENAAAYQRLRLEALQESPSAFGSSYADEADRSLSEIETRVTPAADGSFCVFGAFDEDRLVGVLAFVRASRQKLRHGAELCGMYVTPESRGAGIGGALMDAALAYARGLPGMRQVKLTVNATNAAARALYRSRGFGCIGVEPDALRVEGRYDDEEYYFLHLWSDTSP